MRFALALSSIFAIGALTAGGLSYLMQSHDMRTRLEAELQADADSLAQLAAEGDPDEMREQIAALESSSGGGDSLYGFADARSGAQLGVLGHVPAFEGSRRLVVGRDFPAVVTG